MPSLLQLPQSIWRDLIPSLLHKVEDLVRLDNAVMNRVEREEYLANISGCKRFGNFRTKMKSGKIKWFALRNFIVNYVAFSGRLHLVDEMHISQFLSSAHDISLFGTLPYFTSRDLMVNILGAQTLRQLSLYHCEVVDVSALSQCKRITYMRVQDCSNISDKSFAEGITGCIQLKICYIHRCTMMGTDSVVALLRWCANLKALDLIGSFDLDAVMSQITAPVALESFNSANPLFSTELTRATVLNIAAFLPRLRTLRLHHVSHAVTDNDIKDLAQSCKCIRDLLLYNNALLTDDVLLTIARCLPQMQSIRIEWCERISTAGVVALVQSMTILHTIHLNSLHITDAAVQAVGTHCRSLTDLDVSYCSAITDYAFTTLNVTCLQCLNVSRTRVRGFVAAHMLSSSSALHCLDCLYSNIDTSLVRSLAPFDKLLTLRISSQSLTTADWLELSTMFPSLHHLEVKSSLAVNDDVAQSFHEHCSNLIIANFKGCSVSDKY